MEKSKRPSYFEKVREQYRELVGRVEPDELAAESFKFFRHKMAESYWNGVEHGASGKVQPKAGRPAKK